jgi:hypothetical protein
MDWNHTWQKCSLLGPDQVLLLFVLIGHPTWLPAPIKASDCVITFLADRKSKMAANGMS